MGTNGFSILAQRLVTQMSHLILIVKIKKIKTKSRFIVTTFSPTKSLLRLTRHLVVGYDYCTFNLPDSKGSILNEHLCKFFTHNH